jgi:hypothetical protein
MITRMAVKLALVLAPLGCQTANAPDPKTIAPWTTQLRDAQPEDAFAAVYFRRGRQLVFVGAQHENKADSLTFRIIADAYASFQVDTLIAEGFPYARGANPPRIIGEVVRQNEVDGFVEDGELVPAVRGALAQGANVWGGEPDDAAIRDRMLSQGISREDLLGFYTLRSIPQWIRERRIDGPGDARVSALIEDELRHNRGRLGIDASLLPDFAAWTRWYGGVNGKPFGAAFVLEEAGPLADGASGSNRIAAAVGLVRDAFLLETIARHLNAGENVVVVFGESHLMRLRPALDDMLGAPCYVGNTLRDAPARCSD